MRILARSMNGLSLDNDKDLKKLSAEIHQELLGSEQETRIAGKMVLIKILHHFPRIKFFIVHTNLPITEGIIRNAAMYLNKYGGG